MKYMTRCKHILLLLLCLVLVAAIALFASGCQTEGDGDGTTEAPQNAAPPTELGEGATQFTLEVVDDEGKLTSFLISTDRETVGEALLELGLIEGDEGAYGLYIKKVNGVFAEYETTGTYWAFYVGGKFALKGISETEIEAGVIYRLAVSE